ncbi:MAG: mannose-1-phosphate guanylyltransferase [Thermoplasmatota archaeon]
MKAVVLAGGSGERFWPLSTPETPKQFLRLFGDRTLIEQTVERLLMRFDPEDILVITSAEHVARTIELLPNVPPENIIGEPLRRNTAPACMVGALMGDPDEVQLVVPADHRISEPEDFWKDFDRGLASLESQDGLYTFGIHPTRPDTGYGYIEAGRSIGMGVFEVERFREKPDQKTAEGFLEKGGYYWNSGMFLWRSSTLIAELEKCDPDVHGPLRGVHPDDLEMLAEAYAELPSRSIDHAVMEKSSQVRMVKGEFDWSDVGTWASIIDLKGYCSGSGDRILKDSASVFIHSTTKRPIGVVGLNGILIIDTENGLLVCSEDMVQKVRDISIGLRSKDGNGA